MSKSSKATVMAHPSTGAIITPRKNNPEYGVIRVDQETVSMENGFLNKSNRTAWIGGKVSDLESLNLKEGSALPGKIVRRESHTPFYEGQSPKINPSTNEVIEKNGQPVYFQDTYTEDLGSPSYAFTEAEALVEVTAEAGQTL